MTMKQKNVFSLNKEIIMEELKKIHDPEIGHSIVDLGLIYRVATDKKNVDVVMTFTSPFCPVGEFLVDSVTAAVKKLGGKAKVEVTFDPPWGPEKITPELRSILGFDL